MTEGVSVAADRAAADASVSDRLAAWAEGVRREELETATARLRADGEPLDPAVRTALEELTRSLVDGVVGEPARAVAAAERADERATVRHAVDLFELNEPAAERESWVAVEPAGDATEGAIPARSD
ncbi:MAG: hypothetical protein ABEJ92_05725 [Halobacteriales archaeon]